MGNVIGKQDGEQSLGLHKFGLLRVIGRGSFGKVRIVEHNETRKTFALKYIDKAECIKMKAQQNILRERDILEEIDHPFVVNLRFSFQDDTDMFMVMDLMMGGDLRFHMQRRRFVESVIRFWVAEVACALDYLHTNHSVVHRDIKPDNILMDDRGHVALTDFNIAARIRDGKPHYSVAGTANYMAPELISGQGYTFSVDWWSLGVVMYECIYGKRPFRHGNDVDKLKRAIVEDEIQFPMIADVQVSYECISAMRELLQKDPAKRLGASGYEGFKRHPFFASIDWDRLESKQLEPLFVPDQNQPNFDIAYDLEEMLLEEEPLELKSKKPRKLRIGAEQETPEQQLISRGFAAFDFIEYERFKRYIDANGAIDSAAVESVRLSRPTSDSSVESISVPLSHLKLDGRPIINFALQSDEPISPSPPLSASSRKSVNIGRTSGQRRPTMSSGQFQPVSPIDEFDSRRPPMSDSAQLAALAIGGGLFTNRTSEKYRQRTASQRRMTENAASRSSTSNNSQPSIQAATPAYLALPGTLEPPKIVPIDILTWNQMLPEQRSLAYRFSVKMKHDRQRDLKWKKHREHQQKQRQEDAEESIRTERARYQARHGSVSIATTGSLSKNESMHRKALSNVGYCNQHDPTTPPPLPTSPIPPPLYD